MNDVKFVIGLIELAAVVKFLSVADIGLSASGIPVFVTYSVFLWLWIAIAACAGLYLLGLKIGPRPKLSAPAASSPPPFCCLPDDWLPEPSVRHCLTISSGVRSQRLPCHRLTKATSSSTRHSDMPSSSTTRHGRWNIPGP